MPAPILAAIAAALAQSPNATTADLGAQTMRETVVPPPAKCLEAETADAPAPKVVSTFPAEGQVVRPGLVIVRITFDRPMTCSGFLGAIAGSGDPCPLRHQTFIESFDHRTVRTPCLTEPGRAYGLAVGAARSAPFVSLEGRQAHMLEIHFRTSGAASVTSAREALAEDTGAGSPGSDADLPLVDAADPAPVRPRIVAAVGAQKASLKPPLSLQPALDAGRRRCAGHAARIILGTEAGAAVAYATNSASACR